MPLTKLEREYAALAVVYNDRVFGEIDHGDRPDFVVRLRRTTERFGIEVTDLFANEAEARVHIHSNYLSDLFAGGRHMHRDDESLLPVSRVRVTDKDGSVRHEDLPTILKEPTTSMERAVLLADVIRRKTLASSQYRSDLGHLNLIVSDWTDVGPEPDEDYPANELLTEGVRRALDSSAFREVFLIGRARNGSLHYRPLRMLVLMDSFFTFVRAFEEFDVNCPVTSSDEMVRLYVRVMQYAGLPVYLGCKVDTLLAVYYGNGAGIDRGMIIHDFRDGALPVPLDPGPDDGFPYDGLVTHLREFRAGQRFVTQLALAEETRRA